MDKGEAAARLSAALAYSEAALASLDAAKARSRQGQKACRAMASFLGERSSLEAAHGEALARAAKRAWSNQKGGGFAPRLAGRWALLVDSLSSVAAQHTTLAACLGQDASRALQTVSRQQAAQLERLGAESQALLNNMEATQSKFFHAKAAYERACMDAERVIEVRDKAHAALNATPPATLPSPPQAALLSPLSSSSSPVENKSPLAQLQFAASSGASARRDRSQLQEQPPPQPQQDRDEENHPQQQQQQQQQQQGVGAALANMSKMFDSVGAAMGMPLALSAAAGGGGGGASGPSGGGSGASGSSNTNNGYEAAAQLQDLEERVEAALSRVESTEASYVLQVMSMNATCAEFRAKMEEKLGEFNLAEQARRGSVRAPLLRLRQAAAAASSSVNASNGPLEAARAALVAVDVGADMRAYTTYVVNSAEARQPASSGSAQKIACGSPESGGAGLEKAGMGAEALGAAVEGAREMANDAAKALSAMCSCLGDVAAAEDIYARGLQRLLERHGYGYPSAAAAAASSSSNVAASLGGGGSSSTGKAGPGAWAGAAVAWSGLGGAASAVGGNQAVPTGQTCAELLRADEESASLRSIWEAAAIAPTAAASAAHSALAEALSEGPCAVISRLADEARVAAKHAARQHAEASKSLAAVRAGHARAGARYERLCRDLRDRVEQLNRLRAEAPDAAAQVSGTGAATAAAALLASAGANNSAASSAAAAADQLQQQQLSPPPPQQLPPPPPPPPSFDSPNTSSLGMGSGAAAGLNSVGGSVREAFGLTPELRARTLESKVATLQQDMLSAKTAVTAAVAASDVETDRYRAVSASVLEMLRDSQSARLAMLRDAMLVAVNARVEALEATSAAISVERASPPEEDDKAASASTQKPERAEESVDEKVEGATKSGGAASNPDLNVETASAGSLSSGLNGLGPPSPPGVPHVVFTAYESEALQRARAARRSRSDGGFSFAGAAAASAANTSAREMAAAGDARMVDGAALDDSNASEAAGIRPDESAAAVGGEKRQSHGHRLSLSDGEVSALGAPDATEAADAINLQKQQHGRRHRRHSRRLNSGSGGAANENHSDSEVCESPPPPTDQAPLSPLHAKTPETGEKGRFLVNVAAAGERESRPAGYAADLDDSEAETPAKKPASNSAALGISALALPSFASDQQNNGDAAAGGSAAAETAYDSSALAASGELGAGVRPSLQSLRHWSARDNALFSDESGDTSDGGGSGSGIVAEKQQLRRSNSLRVSARSRIAQRRAPVDDMAAALEGVASESALPQSNSVERASSGGSGGSASGVVVLGPGPRRFQQTSPSIVGEGETTKNSDAAVSAVSAAAALSSSSGAKLASVLGSATATTANVPAGESEEFFRQFPDLPERARRTERVVESYSCALFSGGLPLHGRLSVTQGYGLFAGWRSTRLVVVLAEVASVDKAPPMLLMPSALTISKRNGEKITLGSFLYRDDCLALLRQLTQISSELNTITGGPELTNQTAAEAAAAVELTGLNATGDVTDVTDDEALRQEPRETAAGTALSEVLPADAVLNASGRFETLVDVTLDCSVAQAFHWLWGAHSSFWADFLTWQGEENLQMGVWEPLASQRQTQSNATGSDDEVLLGGAYFPNETFSHGRGLTFQHPRTTFTFIGPRLAPTRQRQAYRLERRRQSSEIGGEPAAAAAAVAVAPLDRAVICWATSLEGIPMSDTFSILGRMVITRRPGLSKCHLQGGIEVVFHKQTMLKGKIRDGTVSESRDAWTAWQKGAESSVKFQRERLGPAKVEEGAALKPPAQLLRRALGLTLPPGLANEATGAAAKPPGALEHTQELPGGPSGASAAGIEQGMYPLRHALKGGVSSGMAKALCVAAAVLALLLWLLLRRLSKLEQDVLMLLEESRRTTEALLALRGAAQQCGEEAASAI